MGFTSASLAWLRMALGHVDPMGSFFAEKDDVHRLLEGLSRETARLLQLTDDEGRGVLAAGRAGAGATGEDEGSHAAVLARCVRAGQGYATKLQVSSLTWSGVPVFPLFFSTGLSRRVRQPLQFTNARLSPFPHLCGTVRHAAKGRPRWQR